MDLSDFIGQIKRVHRVLKHSRGYRECWKRPNRQMSGSFKGKCGKSSVEPELLEKKLAANQMLCLWVLGKL